MKRFYEAAAVAAVEGGFQVQLDGRAVRTPDRQKLTFPGEALALASAAEWNEQGEELDMATMPMTAMAYAAVDRVTAEPARFIEEAARFAETDLLCYRAPEPADLIALQQESWDPLLEWVGERHGATFALAEGIMPIDQPKQSIAAVKSALGALDPFRLTAAHMATQAAGSVIIALALIEGRVDATAAADAAQLEDIWHINKWGEDDDARVLMTRRRESLVEIDRFLSLLS